MALTRSGQSAADDVGGSRSPVKTGEDRFLDLESIQQGDSIDRQRRRLAVPGRFTGKETRRAVTTQIRDDHAVARSCKHGRDIDKAVNVVGPAVQQNHNGPIGGTGLCVTHIEDAGIDLLQRSERRICSWLDGGQFLPPPVGLPQDRSSRAAWRRWPSRRCQKSGADLG